MSLDPRAVIRDCPTPPSGGLRWVLVAHRRSVAAGRRLVIEALAGKPEDHTWAAVQCASELLTNALAAAGRYATGRQISLSGLDAPIRLAIHPTARWTRIDVRDPETVLHPVGPHGSLDEDGRGLGIVMALGHFAHTVFADHKVVHALLPLGEPLTDAERAAALVTA